MKVSLHAKTCSRIFEYMSKLEIFRFHLTLFPVIWYKVVFSRAWAESWFNGTDYCRCWTVILFRRFTFIAY